MSSATQQTKHGGANAGLRISDMVVAFVLVIGCVLVGREERLLGITSVCVVALFLRGTATWVALLYLALIMAFPTWINSNPMMVGLGRVYVTDLLVLLLVWVGLHIAIDPSGTSRVERLDRSQHVLLASLAFYTLYGLVSLAMGLFMEHHAYADALGDYRRLFLYSCALAVPVLLAVRCHHVTAIERIVPVAGSALVALAFYRIITSTPVRVDVDNVTEHVGLRLLGPDEMSTLALLIAYGTVTARVGGSRFRKLLGVVLALCAVPPLLMSGYRVGIFYVAAAPATALILYTWVRREQLGMTARLLAVTVLLFFLAMAATPVLFPSQFERMKLDLMVRMQSSEIQGGWRSSAQNEAFLEWLDRPLLGKSLGHRLVFPYRTSDGAYLYIDSGSHNLFVEILLKAGLLAFVPYVFVHVFFAWYAGGSLRSLVPRYQPVLVVLFSGYLCNMLGCLLQSPGVSRFAYTHLLMGFVLAGIHHCRDRGLAVESELAR